MEEQNKIEKNIHIQNYLKSKEEKKKDFTFLEKAVLEIECTQWFLDTLTLEELYELSILPGFKWENLSKKEDQESSVLLFSYRWKSYLLENQEMDILKEIKNILLKDDVKPLSILIFQMCSYLVWDFNEDIESIYISFKEKGFEFEKDTIG